MRLVMRTIMRSTELGANTNVFFRVISQPVKCALTVTVHKQGKGRGWGEREERVVEKKELVSSQEKLFHAETTVQK